MLTNTHVAVSPETACFHCGEATGDGGIVHDGKTFCCSGCVCVYDLLRESNLCQYYKLQDTPGISPAFTGDKRYEYLDDPATVEQLLEFALDRLRAVTFTIPSMHCSSCVWLLENLHSLNGGILQSRVDFLRKAIHIRFSAAVPLRAVVELLASLGYEPEISLASVNRQRAAGHNRSLYYRIGVAGFCFANIMLLSLPEYFSGGTVDPDLDAIFRLLRTALALPVFFYSSSDYFRSAWRGLRQKIITLDVPIALGIGILFIRSLADILTGAGPGFLDSMTGLVFFLLVGRLFQAKTYENLNFERTYTSYFPLAVTVRKNGSESTIPLSQLAVGDRVVVRNEGLVPADALLLSDGAAIDYSFVTGESRIVPHRAGDLVYAGGRQRGSAIDLRVLRGVSEGYLTRLWNTGGEETPGRHSMASIANAVGKYFTGLVLVLAAVAAAIWFPEDPIKGLNAVTGVLIVACPCALALSTPFTFGSILRVFGRHGFFLKNASVVESLAKVDTVVLDKTGTLTCAGEASVRFMGESLTGWERNLIASLVAGSAHPSSRAIQAALGTRSLMSVENFSERPGEGLAGRVDGVVLQVGSRDFVEQNLTQKCPGDKGKTLETRVYVAIDGIMRGYFALGNQYRQGLEGALHALARRHSILVLSGDNEAERANLEALCGEGALLHFDQSPADKLKIVGNLQERGGNVLMVGDGLNDAAALRRSDVGIAVAEDAVAFTPACDAILSTASLIRLPDFVQVAKVGVGIVVASFAFSFLYNVAALTLAMRGELTPILAAILMPLSSVTVVALATFGVRILTGMKGLR